MNNLIDRQALCDDLREYKVHPVPVSSDESEVKGYNDGIDLAISVIAKFPSAEPERNRGELKTIGFLTSQCSECKAQFHELEYTNYCPNCGTKWEESQR